MSTFTKFDASLHTEYDHAASKKEGRDLWRVLTPFSYYVGEIENNIWVTVPSGYLTDGATIPRLFWSLLPPWGEYGQAAVLHDYLCDTMSYIRDGELIAITRPEVDRILLEAMEVLEVASWKRWTIYSAVKAYWYFRQIVPKKKETLAVS